MDTRHFFLEIRNLPESFSEESFRMLIDQLKEEDLNLEGVNLQGIKYVEEKKVILFHVLSKEEVATLYMI
jgi:hypothetical protein